VDFLREPGEVGRLVAGDLAVHRVHARRGQRVGEDLRLRDRAGEGVFQDRAVRAPGHRDVIEGAPYAEHLVERLVHGTHGRAGCQHQRPVDVEKSNFIPDRLHHLRRAECPHREDGW